MTTGHVFIATSLDGFVARENRALDWLMKQPTQGEDHGYEAFMESVDGLIMGRGSFETVLTFDEWPYSKPVVVMSKTLGPADVPGHLKDRVRIVATSPSEVMEDLDRRGWSRAYVDGGLLIQSFIAEALIVDMVLTTVPTLIGSGRRLFGPLDADVDLELLGVTSFPSGLVQHRYRFPVDR